MGNYNLVLFCDSLDRDCLHTRNGAEYQGNLTRLKDGNKTCSGPCRNTNNDPRGPSCDVKDEKGTSTRREYCDIPLCSMYSTKALIAQICDIYILYGLFSGQLGD